MDLAIKYDLSPQTVRNIYYRYSRDMKLIKKECERSVRRAKWRAKVKELKDKYGVTSIIIGRLMRGPEVRVYYMIDLTNETFNLLELAVKRWVEKHK